MNLKTKEDIIKKTSIELGIDEKIIAAVYNEYWSSVQKKLTSIENINDIKDLRVDIPKLGVFLIKEKRVSSRIKTLEGYAIKYPKVARKNLTTVDHLKNIRDLFGELFNLRIDKRKERSEYEQSKEGK